MANKIFIPVKIWGNKTALIYSKINEKKEYISRCKWLRNQRSPHFSFFRIKDILLRIIEANVYGLFCYNDAVFTYYVFNRIIDNLNIYELNYGNQ